MDKRVERGRATRDQLVETATRLFADSGFDGTSIEAVLEAAGVSRGSLYHHFASKEALFEAAFMAVEADIGADVLRVWAGTDDVVAGLRAGCLEWMRLARDPVVQRVVLIDARRCSVGSGGVRSKRRARSGSSRRRCRVLQPRGVFPRSCQTPLRTCCSRQSTSSR